MGTFFLIILFIETSPKVNILDKFVKFCPCENIISAFHF